MKNKSYLFHDFLHFIYSLGALGKKKKSNFPAKIPSNLAESGRFRSFPVILKKSGQNPAGKKQLIFSRGKKPLDFLP